MRGGASSGLVGAKMVSQAVLQTVAATRIRVEAASLLVVDHVAVGKDEAVVSYSSRGNDKTAREGAQHTGANGMGRPGGGCHAEAQVEGEQTSVGEKTPPSALEAQQGARALPVSSQERSPPTSDRPTGAEVGRVRSSPARRRLDYNGGSISSGMIVATSMKEGTSDVPGAHSGNSVAIDGRTDGGSGGAWQSSGDAEADGESIGGNGTAAAAQRRLVVVSQLTMEVNVALPFSAQPQPSRSPPSPYALSHRQQHTAHDSTGAASGTPTDAADAPFQLGSVHEQGGLLEREAAGVEGVSGSASEEGAAHRGMRGRLSHLLQQADQPEPEAGGRDLQGNSSGSSVRGGDISGARDGERQQHEDTAAPSEEEEGPALLAEEAYPARGVDERHQRACRGERRGGLSGDAEVADGRGHYKDDTVRVAVIVSTAEASLAGECE